MRRSSRHEMKGATRVRSADWAVCSLIVALGVLQFMLPQKGSEFYRGDTIYIEFARSILESGTYELEFNDVVYPPGLPMLLALLSVTVGSSHAELVQSMAVFVTLALLMSYHHLRREAGRNAAAAVCLLIASSPLVFELSTQSVSSDLPYFFTSVTVLVVACHLDRAKDPSARLSLGLLCGVMLLSSLLMRSSGVALIAGLGGWLVLGGLCTDPATRARRFKSFTGILLVGLVFQAVWMGWVSKYEQVEWPMLEGHPRSYTSQLKVKSGVRPELGTASLTDVVLRVPTNVAARSIGLSQLVTRKDYIESAWYSPLVLLPVLFIAVGLGSSLRIAGGGLTEWYFISHEAMYLVWPWPYEMRFLLPVAPLACLYLWRGGGAIGRRATQSPRAVGMVAALLGLMAGATAFVAASTSNSLQPRLAVGFWAIVVAVSACIAAKPASRIGASAGLWTGCQRVVMPFRTSHLTVLHCAGAATMAGLVALGIALQVGIGLNNRIFDVTGHLLYQRVKAARWIDQHTASRSVVMARQHDVIYHHANRRVVWFAPISDPKVLMDGIERLHVDYILATDMWNYYLPTENDSVAALVKRYPQALRIVHEESNWRIYEVVHGGTSPGEPH